MFGHQGLLCNKYYPPVSRYYIEFISLFRILYNGFVNIGLQYINIRIIAYFLEKINKF